MVKQKKDKRSRKAVFGFVALFAAVAVIVGVGYAYFSDVITGNGQATAGTLDISGTVSLTQNGHAVDGTSITNLNPGDVIGIGIVGQNEGTKSAWVRNTLSVTDISTDANTAVTNNGTNGTTAQAANAVAGQLSTYLWYCTTTIDQATLIAKSEATGGFSDAANKPDDCTQITATGTIASTTPVIVSGSLEPDGTSTTLPTAGGVIYFDAAAPNGAQNGNVKFALTIQALQYRNLNGATGGQNGTAVTGGQVPSTSQWNTVTTTPFAL